ncbi:MAG: Ig-like domain-containing protein [Treponema sp.]|nr:Ig-like domain-containing protein [Treponema sp.]
MKKLLLVKSSIVFFAGLFLAGCQLFTENSLLKNQLEEEIQYANADSYTITLETESSDYGQLSQSSIKLKNSDKVSIKFLLASGYSFKSWECNDSDAIKFGDASAPETTVTLVNGRQGLVISALCYKDFALESITPKNNALGVEQDSPIIIKFSEAADPESFENKVKILNEDSVDISSSHFDSYIWSDNNTVLKIPVKKEVSILESGLGEITITFLEGIYNSDHSKSLEKNLSYTYRINSDKDLSKPVITSFKIAKSKEALLSEDSSDLIKTSSYYELSQDFHVGKSIWLYCSVSDQGSGAYNLVINSNINAASGQFQLVDTLNNAYEIGPYQLDISSFDDGPISLSFAVSDYCDNKSTSSYLYKFYKDSSVQIPSDVKIYNKLPEDEIIFTNVVENDGSDFNIYYQSQDFMDSYRRIYVSGVTGDTWGDNFTEELSQDSVKIFYTLDQIEKEAEFVKMTEESESSGIYTYEFLLEEIEDLDQDLELQVEFYDSLGNSALLNPYIPGSDLQSFSYQNNSYGQLYLKAQKACPENTSLTFRYFNEFTWDDSAIEYFNEETSKNRNSSGELYQSPDGDEIDFDFWFNMHNSYWASNGKSDYIQKNQTYIKDSYYYDDFYIFGNPQTSDSDYRSVTIANDSSASDIEVTTCDYINIPKYSAGSRYQDNSYLGDNLQAYILPLYSSSRANLYGKAIKKEVFIGQIQSSSDYELTFSDLIDITPGEANSSVTKASLKDVKVTYLGEDVSSDFDFTYYIKNDQTIDYYYQPDIEFDSILTDGGEYRVLGVIATKKSDSSVKIRQEIGTLVPACDNYPPYFKELGSSYYNTLPLTHDYIKIPLLYQNPDTLTYEPLFDDKTISSQNKFGVSANNQSAAESVNYDYYWLPYDSSWGQNLPNLQESTIEDSAVLKGSSYFNWWNADSYVSGGNASLRMNVPYDLSLLLGKYLLCVKIYDGYGNYCILPILYEDFEFIEDSELECTSENTTITGVSLTLSDSSLYRKQTLLIMEVYNSSTKTWGLAGSVKIARNNNILSLDGSYSLGNYLRLRTISYKAIEEASDQSPSILYSYPKYLNLPAEDTSSVNLLDTDYGVTITGNALVEIIYAPKGEGFGNNINKWKIYGTIADTQLYSGTGGNPYNITDLSALPQDCEYVIVAHFYNGQTYISGVYNN